LAKELPHACFIFRHLGIDLGIGAFEIDVGQDSRRAVPGAGDIDCVRIRVPDQAVQVYVDQVQAGSSPPVAEKAWLDVFGPERFPQQGIIPQVDLSRSQIIRRLPVGVYPAEVLV
jgi:hypothetical protein